MSQHNEIDELARRFEALGAPAPMSWAKSQVKEGINQYARFVFLRQAWKNVIPDGDTSWIDPLIEQSGEGPDDPGAGAGPALVRLLASGGRRHDIAEVVRVMQWRILSRLAYQLSDPGAVDYPSDDLPRVFWALFETDEEGNPVRTIDCLHESVLDTDPSGREMSPRRPKRPR